MVKLVVSLVLLARVIFPLTISHSLNCCPLGAALAVMVTVSPCAYCPLPLPLVTVTVYFDAGTVMETGVLA